VNRGTHHNPWALYDLATDRCEMVDLSSEKPERCKQMQARWQACENDYRNQPE
jgi:hypothetical protein